MFNLAFEKLAKGDLSQLENNAFLEVFLLHARCLIDFLYRDEVDHSDDVIAGDFFENAENYSNLRPEIDQSLLNLKQRAGKEIAHLTYNRLEITPEMKQWKFVEIWKEINNTLAIFFKCLPYSEKSWFRIISLSQ